MTAPTFAVGDIVRVRGIRGLFKILDFKLVQGEVVLYGGAGQRAMTRYVTSDRLLPSRPGDVWRRAS